MKPIIFRGMNVTYAKDQPELYKPLPAKKWPGEHGIVTTKWKANLWERISFLVCGRIYLHQMTFNQPLQPVILNFIDQPK